MPSVSDSGDKSPVLVEDTVPDKLPVSVDFPDWFMEEEQVYERDDLDYKSEFTN